MLLDFGGLDGGWYRAWKCLGCGRETLDNAVVQAEDDRLLAEIRRDSVRGRTR
jgi:hypothetical protein